MTGRAIITPGYAQLMARYNRWQNASLYAAAGELSDEERRRDRGAFFGSIHATLNHLYWADRMWLSRFGAISRPRTGSIQASVDEHPTFAALAPARDELDRALLAWAEALTEDQLATTLKWHSGALKRDVTRPAALIVVHLFNHQTHHRGQVHAMLTAAGARPEDTDIPYMPGVETM